MNKLILCSILAVGLCYCKENCEFLNIDENSYSSSHIKIYNFSCTGVKGYDYVDHNVWVEFDQLNAVSSNYYIDGTDRKHEYFGYRENEKSNGEIEIIGISITDLYDEFHIEIKSNCYSTSFESMEKTLLNKWNRLKKYINKQETVKYKTDETTPTDINNCPPSLQVGGRCLNN